MWCGVLTCGLVGGALGCAMIRAVVCACARWVRMMRIATAVQVVYLSPEGSRGVEPLGSVHDEEEFEALRPLRAMGH